MSLDWRDLRDSRCRVRGLRQLVKVATIAFCAEHYERHRICRAAAASAFRSSGSGGLHALGRIAVHARRGLDYLRI